jgi:hypothetical protein
MNKSMQLWPGLEKVTLFFSLVYVALTESYGSFVLSNMETDEDTRLSH